MISVFVATSFAGSRRFLLCSDSFFSTVTEMGRTREKRVVNTQEPGALPPKRKRGKAMESTSSISQADGPQHRVTGRRRSRRGGAANRGSVMVEEQLLSQADPPDEVLTHTDTGQTVVQNNDKPVIRRQDIASLAQEIMKYLGTVNNVAGSGQQESSSPPSE